MSFFVDILPIFCRYFADIPTIVGLDLTQLFTLLVWICYDFCPKFVWICYVFTQSWFGFATIFPKSWFGFENLHHIFLLVFENIMYLCA